MDRNSSTTVKYGFHSVYFNEIHIDSINFCGHLGTEIYPNWKGEKRKKERKKKSLKTWTQFFAPKYCKAFIAHIFMKLTISQ
jgi:hypothetical protein